MGEIEEDDKKYINFNVDSGLIDRLGRELVGKSETAVSELIKNAYDADATEVDVKFINTNFVGGTLQIIDNGLGMTRTELEKGFMTISSSDKIHNPKSSRYNRNKAGRKGIGRFATQRLGRQLIIITQKKNSLNALKITINWDDYKIDTNLTDIKNLIEEIDKTKEEGTELIINNLREYWTESEIKRVYRYVSDLLQPDYLSDRSKELKIAKQKDESFKVNFKELINGIEKVIADPNKMIFDKAIAVIEGWIDNTQNGYCTVVSDSLDLIDSDRIPILHGKKIGERDKIVNKKIIKEPIIEDRFLSLHNVRFKVYYFIYNREAYYANVSRLELKSIQNIASEQSGIKLYRNGFRVLPYGEKNDDWLSIDRRYYDESGAANIPFGNHNFFGFVEIIDSDGDLFEETASREGLLENEAYKELKDFVHKALEGARIRIRYGIKKKRDELNPRLNPILNNDNTNKSPIEKLDDLQSNINSLVEGSGDEQQVQIYKDNIRRYVTELKFDFQNLLDELGMTRVLAGLGLTIGEFTHEVVQFSPSMNGDLSVLSQQELNPTGIESLENLTRTIKLFTSYTSYFNATVSANASRELKPQKVDEIVTNFKKIIDADLINLNIDFEIELYGFDLITIPMHSSEWSSILFNLYTNSKKAIRRADVVGQIKIIVGKENENLYLEFQDNGDGIPEANVDKIFDAFFTTSAPLGFETTIDERLTGTGLGLKIIKDIINTYGGSIELTKPDLNYQTCFRIEIPLASEKQKKEHGL